LITGAAELSFLSEKPGARSDLDALSALDSNRDRKIDATDLRFGELKVWVDANRNGVTDAGELRTLQDLNIASISLAAATTKQSVKPGQNILLATGSFTFNDGTVRSLGDAALAFEPGRGSASFAPAAAAAGNAFDLDLPGLVTARQGRSIEDAQSDLASALRTGLGDRLSLGSAGLSFGLPAEVNPFDYFADMESGSAAGGVPADGASARGLHRQDMPEMQVAVDAGADAPVAPDAGSASIGDLQVARMVQTMAGFGRSQGENEWKNRDRGAQRFDYFA
ncbi:MAG TPA: hypothetical protein VF535_06670, partial [Allosphingosinicella sp.]